MGNVSEMVHRKVFQTSFRPLLDLSLGYFSIIVVVVAAVAVVVGITKILVVVL